MISSLTGFRTDGMVMSLEQDVAGLWLSEEDTRSIKEGFARGIGSEIVRTGHWQKAGRLTMSFDIDTAASSGCSTATWSTAEVDTLSLINELIYIL